jgi:hypothetical protein
MDNLVGTRVRDRFSSFNRVGTVSAVAEDEDGFLKFKVMWDTGDEEMFLLGDMTDFDHDFEELAVGSKVVHKPTGHSGTISLVVDREDVIVQWNGSFGIVPLKELT